MLYSNGKMIPILRIVPTTPPPPPPPPPPTPLPRVLVLVLASDTQPIYLEHQRLWRTYMRRNPNVDCYFYKGDPTLESEAELKGDTLFLRIEDTLQTVHEKTLMAFKYFLPQLSQYKCVFRTNLSSVVVFDRYLEYCKTIPSEGFCSAFTGVGVENDERYEFPGGAGYTLTSDLVRRYVEEWPPVLHQDDLTLGYVLHRWGIPITQAPRADILSEFYETSLRGRIPSTYFHFRVKQLTRHDGGEEDPYELEIMQNLISEHYDDPMTRRMEVVVRMCPDSREPISGNSSRPSWFSKEAAFRSMFLTKGPNVRVTVLFDGDPSEHWITNYPVKVVPIQGGDGDKSFLCVLDYIRSQVYPDNTIVYCLEDDYPHRPGWDTVLREGLAPLTPEWIKFDYVTLYDHLDKYTWPMYKDLTARLAISPSVHWRTVPSTTNTWCCLAKTLRKDFDVFWAFKNRDNDKFLTLGRQGRVIGSCIPGYSTHAHSEHISPRWPDQVIEARIA